MNLANRKGPGKGLGKGLGAIIPQGSVFAGGRTIVNLDVSKIIPNPRQPRTNFIKASLQELADSIKEQGVIEPILVRQKDGNYELVAGERRLRAAKIAGLATIPTIIKSFSDEQSMELALIENLQREDLNPMDEAEGYAKLAAEFKLTQEVIAKKVGKNRSTVANMIRLLNLPKEIKGSLRSGEISRGHARAILAEGEPEKQLVIWHQIVENKLNVRDVEVIAAAPDKAKKGGKKRPLTQNTELKDLVEKLTTHLGTKVSVFGSPERGKIEINYYSKEDLERILEVIQLEKPEARSIASIAS
ncbi:MAG: ParB/RepB/Spo0J family partition protein [bacterium]